MKRSRVHAAIITLCLLGAGLSSTNLLQSLADENSVLQRLSIACGTDRSLCEAAESSPWSYVTLIPGLTPLPADLLGCLYFLFLAVWLLCTGRPNRAGRAWHVIPLWTVFFGLLMTVYMVGILLWQGFPCVRCFLIHGINLIVAAGVVWLWPRSRELLPVPASPLAQMLDPSASPSPRVALTSLAFCGVLVSLVVVRLEYSVLLDSYEILSEDYYDQVGNPAVMEALYWEEEVHEIPLRVDDPIQGPAAAPATVVVFSDPTCGACRRLHAFVRDELLPASAGGLRIVHKHRPTLIPDDIPPDGLHDSPAWLGARVLETVRRTAGAEAMFSAQEHLAENYDALEQGDLDGLLTLLGVDAAEARLLASSPEVIRRIEEDLELSRELEHGETVPKIYLEGRSINQWDNLELWRRILKLPPGPVLQEMEPGSGV